MKLKAKGATVLSVSKIVTKIRRTATTKKIQSDDDNRNLDRYGEESEDQDRAMYGSQTNGKLRVGDDKLRLGVIQEEPAISDCNTRYTSNAAPSISTA